MIYEGSRLEKCWKLSFVSQELIQFKKNKIENCFLIVIIFHNILQFVHFQI